jgi:Uma2 family endonuclease
MSTAIAERLYTCDEFDALPNPDDGRKMELVDGRVVFSMPVGRIHGRLAAAIATWLNIFVWPRELGEVYAETGFRLRELPVRRGRVRGPDVSFVRASRLPPESETERGSLRLAPDLAIEVVSPDEREDDLQAKIAMYFEAGTPIVWVVRPRTKTIEVMTRAGGSSEFREGDTLTSIEAGFEVEGFSLPLADLFR